MNKVAIVVPTRKGSQRVKNKNTRPFANFENGLLELKLKQLQNVKDATIYLSSNDEASIEIAKQFNENNAQFKIVERPEALCLDTTLLTDLIQYLPTIIEEEHILWTHVTSPMVSSDIYQKSIDTYFEKREEGFDSLMSVHKVQEFLWSKEKGAIVNTKNKNVRWPRTQDLEPYYQINSGIFIAAKECYLAGDRVGKTPYLFEMNALESTDVDWEEDFKIAEALYEKFGQ